MSPLELTNKERVALAKQALEAVEYCSFELLAVEESIVDLMANLLHLASQEGLDPKTVLATAILHFEHEQQTTITPGGQDHVSVTP